jgi:hypothetical protein
MTEQPKWALRRSQTVPQEVVQGPNNYFTGWLKNQSVVWAPDGSFSDDEDPCDLVPLRPVPKKALRCCVLQSYRGKLYIVGSDAPNAVPMIDRAPGDALAAAVRERISAAEPELAKALRAYEEATE